MQPLADVQLAWLEFAPGATVTLPIAAVRSIFFYVVSGSLQVNGTDAKARQLVEFNHDGDELTISASSGAVLLLGHALPFNEPIVSYGPFVMNTEAEIQQAYRDYQRGAFGSWKG